MRIYADHNATSPLLSGLREQLSALLSVPPANPSAVHPAGQRVRGVLEDARVSVARLVDANPNMVTFVGSATEANAAALYGHFLAHYANGKRPRMLISSIEHPSVIENAKHLERSGALVQTIRCQPSGLIDLEHLRDLCAGHDVACIALMFANNETGIVQSVQDAVQIAREYGIPIHVDGVQGVGKCELSVSKLGADSFTLSAHKLGAMAGVAALIGKPLAPLFPGGGQEAGQRGGTQAWQAAALLGAACDLWHEHGKTYRHAMRSARDAFEAAIKSSNCMVVGCDVERLPNTSQIIVPQVRGQALLSAMDLDGVAVSHGSACATGSLSPSPVLLAMGLEQANARSAVRVSFGPEDSAANGEAVARVLLGCAARLRGAFTK